MGNLTGRCHATEMAHVFKEAANQKVVARFLTSSTHKHMSSLYILGCEDFGISSLRYQNPFN